MPSRDIQIANFFLTIHTKYGCYVHHCISFHYHSNSCNTSLTRSLFFFFSNCRKSDIVKGCNVCILYDITYFPLYVFYKHYLVSRNDLYMMIFYSGLIYNISGHLTPPHTILLTTSV